MSKSFSDYFKNKLTGRGTIIKPSEPSDTPNYGRFLPDSRYIKEDNRFSPAGVEWLYLAIGNTESIIKECAEEGLIEDSNKFCGFNDEIRDRINDINSEFKEKNSDCNPLINRDEADTVIENIKNNNICILGNPGTGKTTLLYQIINKLDDGFLNKCLRKKRY